MWNGIFSAVASGCRPHHDLHLVRWRAQRLERRRQLVEPDDRGDHRGRVDAPGGQQVELTEPDARTGGRHLSLQFDADRLVGCNAVGWTEHVGVMRGLVEGQVALGAWKDKLLHDPTLLMEAYLAQAQAQDQDHSVLTETQRA